METYGLLDMGIVDIIMMMILVIIMMCSLFILVCGIIMAITKKDTCCFSAIGKVRKESNMKTYSFIMKLLRLDETRSMNDIADALYGAGCDDATFSMSNNVALLDFDRESESREEALESAMNDIIDAKVCGGCCVINDNKEKQLSPSEKQEIIEYLESQRNGPPIKYDLEKLGAGYFSLTKKLK